MISINPVSVLAEVVVSLTNPFVLVALLVSFAFARRGSLWLAILCGTISTGIERALLIRFGFSMFEWQTLGWIILRSLLCVLAFLAGKKLMESRET